MNVNGHAVLTGVECETCIGVECRADWLDSCFCIILPCPMIRFFSPADLRLFSSSSNNLFDSLPLCLVSQIIVRIKV